MVAPCFARCLKPCPAAALIRPFWLSTPGGGLWVMGNKKGAKCDGCGHRIGPFDVS